MRHKRSIFYANSWKLPPAFLRREIESATSDRSMDRSASHRTSTILDCPWMTPRSPLLGYPLVGVRSRGRPGRFQEAPEVPEALP